MRSRPYSFLLVCFWGLLALCASCVTPFEPDLALTTTSFLSVEGFINGAGVTTIKLARTVNIADNKLPPVETRASLFIEEEGGVRYSLSETKPGTYTSSALTLNPAKKYRLYIKTSNNSEYTSAYTPLKITPEIDSVTWKLEAPGLKVYVNSHDATNQTIYYRWNYEETWQFTSAFRSEFEYKNGEVIPRAENIYECWASENSTAIKVSNTKKLAQDIVYDYALTELPLNSKKLGIRYSILVKQYAQTQEENDYWETLKKNTENIGGLYDSQPTQLTGNIRSEANPTEPVIGFIGAYTETEKRLFIDVSELPLNIFAVTGYEYCTPLDTTIALRDVNLYFANSLFLPLYEHKVYNEVTKQSVLVGYGAAPAECVDCRQRGTNVRPGFWQ